LRRKVVFVAVAAAGLVAAMTVPSGAAPPAPAPVVDQPAVAAASADRLVQAQPGRFKAAAKDRFVRRGVTRGVRGLQHVSYERTYAGLPVIGGDFVVTTNKAGAVLSSSMSQAKKLSVATKPSVSAAEAARVARGELATVTTASEPRLSVLAEGAGRLVYESVVEGAGENNAPSKLHVYVDATSGEVAGGWDEVKDAADDASHYHGTVDTSTAATEMSDPNRPGIRCGGQNGSTFTGPDSAWGNGSGTDLETACVDALYAVQKEWDMLGQWLGRNGIDGNGGGFPARVGLNQANAFWNGSYTNYGRNQAGTKQAVTFDVVAHEYGHAIFQTTPGGSGGGNGNEKGGMNESAGDIFGAITEAYAAEGTDLDEPDYLVGEELDLVGSGPIRNMYDPSALGDPNCYSSSIPNTEVHAAAGPQNHWFYLLAEGSNPANGMPNSPTCDGSTVAGIGVQKAGQIFMGGLNRKVSAWSHARARVETVNAAIELFPGSATECEAVKAAWAAVDVPAQTGEADCGGGPPPGETVFSDDFEADSGWVVNPSGTDAATAGRFERGTGEATSYSGTNLQLAAAGGSGDLVTGASAGADVGANDIDGGATSIQSAEIALPADGTLTLSFSWYFGHLDNAAGDDYLRVRVVGGSETTVLNEVGAGSDRAAGWQTASVDISGHAGQTVRVLVDAADAGTPSLIEAGIDDLKITSAG
jgi:Zn-dependent metalloprotease